MATAATAFEATASPVVESLLIEAILWAVQSAGIPIPRPVIVAAVKALGVIDYDTVSDLLDTLGISNLKRKVWRYFVSEAEGVIAEVKCPESGDTIVLEDGPGEYTCPDCDADIVVDDDRDAEHAYVVECPIEEEKFFLGPEEDADDVCPFCDGEVWIDEGEGHHAYAEVVCPLSGDTIQFAGGEGEYTCPDCNGDINVDDDGDAEHEESAPAPRRHRTSARRRK